MTALDAGFDVDIAFFTTDCHLPPPRDEAMAHRVLRARMNRRHYQLAAVMCDLPPPTGTRCSP